MRPTFLQKYTLNNYICSCSVTPRITSCADSESSAREGPTLTTFLLFLFLVDEGREDLNTTKSRPISARQRNAIEMSLRWQVDYGPILNAGLVALILQGIRASIAKKLYSFVICQRGPGPLSPCLWIRICTSIENIILLKQLQQDK